LDLVGLVPLRGMPAAAGGPAGQAVAERLRRDRQARRAAVDDATDRRSVAFAEGRDGEKLAEGVAGHASRPESNGRSIAACPASRGPPAWPDAGDRLPGALLRGTLRRPFPGKH